MSSNLSHTLRRFGGLHPLCGIGVTSRIDFTSSPTVCRARIADSRPEPGPLTRTSSDRIPTPFAAFPAFKAAWVAANGRALARPLEADSAGARPRDHIPLGVGNRHHGVVKRCLNLRETMVDDPLLAAFLEGLFPLSGGAFFFSGVAPSGAAASALAITLPSLLLSAISSQLA
jgi:hypothetical protein